MGVQVKAVLCLGFYLLGSPIFASGCEGFLELVQPKRTTTSLADTITADRDLRYAFTRALFDSTYEIPQTIQERISKDPFLKRDFAFAQAIKGAFLKLKHGSDNASSFTRQVLATHGAPVFSFHRAQTLKGKIARFVGDILRVPISFLNPLPTDRTFLSPTEKIYAKLWNRLGHYTPAEEEFEKLQKEKAVEHFNQRREFLLNHPKITASRFGFNILEKLGLLFSLGLTANLAATQIFNSNSLMTTTQFLNDRKNDPDEEQVQLLTETTPFPHMAVRIGDTVFSFGVDQLTSSPVALYLNEETLNLKKEKGSLARGAEKPLNRSVQVITLRLGKDKVRNLRKKLELETLKHYHNSTMVNDCARMVMREMDNDYFFDDSPSQLMQYFALRKTLGDKNVKKIVQVSSYDSSFHKTLLLRNSIINSLEATIFIRNFTWFQAQRAIFDVAHSKKGVEYLSAPVQEYLDGEINREKRALEKDPYLLIINEKLSNLKALADDSDQKKSEQERLLFLIQRYFSRETSKTQQVIDAPNSSVENSLRAQARLEYLKKKELEFRKRLGN